MVKQIQAAFTKGEGKGLQALAYLGGFVSIHTRARVVTAFFLVAGVLTRSLSCLDATSIAGAWGSGWDGGVGSRMGWSIELQRCRA